MTHLRSRRIRHIVSQDIFWWVEEADVANAQLQLPCTDRTAAIESSSGRLQRAERSYQGQGATEAQSKASLRTRMLYVVLERRSVMPTTSHATARTV